MSATIVMNVAPRTGEQMFLDSVKRIVRIHVKAEGPVRRASIYQYVRAQKMDAEESDVDVCIGRLYFSGIIRHYPDCEGRELFW
jgi:ribosomal protein L19